MNVNFDIFCDLNNVENMVNGKLIDQSDSTKHIKVRINIHIH